MRTYKAKTDAFTVRVCLDGDKSAMVVTDNFDNEVELQRMTDTSESVVVSAARGWVSTDNRFNLQDIEQFEAWLDNPRNAKWPFGKWVAKPENLEDAVRFQAYLQVLKKSVEEIAISEPAQHLTTVVVSIIGNVALRWSLAEYKEGLSSQELFDEISREQELKRILMSVVTADVTWLDIQAEFMRQVSSLYEEVDLWVIPLTSYAAPNYYSGRLGDWQIEIAPVLN